MPGMRGQSSIPGQLLVEKGLWGAREAGRAPCRGIWSESLSPSSWKANIQARGGGENGGPGKLLEGQISSWSLSLIFQHLAAQFQMLSLGSSFALYSRLGQSVLNESQRGPVAVGRASATCS